MPSMPSVEEWTYAPPGHPDFADVDQVRFYVQDTDPALRLLGDLEIQWLIDQWMPRYDSLIYVASVAAEVISAKLAGVVSVSADGASVNLSDLAERYAAVALKLRTMHDEGATGVEIDVANLMFDTELAWGIKPLSFSVGMHDNRLAGQQDFGGKHIDPWDQALNGG